MTDYDYEDPYDLDGIQQYTLDKSLGLMRRWENGSGGTNVVAAAHAYATIALAVGLRLQTLGGIPEPEPARCEDCNNDVTPFPPDRNWEWFMLRDELWQQAGMTDDGYLCLDCLESRLGRPLNGADLAPGLPVNEPNDDVDSPRLAELKRAATALRKETVNA